MASELRRRSDGAELDPRRTTPVRTRAYELFVAHACDPAAVEDCWRQAEDEAPAREAPIAAAPEDRWRAGAS
jgi:hypothetical protein